MVTSIGFYRGPDYYMNAAELAERLRVSKSWIQRHTRSGEIPCIKIGRKYFYAPDAIDTWLQSCTVLRPVA